MQVEFREEYVKLAAFGVANSSQIEPAGCQVEAAEAAVEGQTDLPEPAIAQTD